MYNGKGQTPQYNARLDAVILLTLYEQTFFSLPEKCIFTAEAL
jgi:hypothetical protein